MPRKRRPLPQETMLSLLTMHWVSQMLFVVAKLGVADALSEKPQTVDAIAEARRRARAVPATRAARARERGRVRRGRARPLPPDAARADAAQRQARLACATSR